MENEELIIFVSSSFKPELGRGASIPDLMDKGQNLSRESVMTMDNEGLASFEVYKNYYWCLY